MLYYKIIRGFGQDDYLSIDETELDKAIYCHVTGKVGVFSSGSISGTTISAIMPDLHAMEGWNQGYKMGPEDYAIARNSHVAAQNFMQLVSDNVKGFMESGQTEKIGKTNYHELEAPKLKLDDGLDKN
jgi:hypothetical protein